MFTSTSQAARSTTEETELVGHVDVLTVRHLVGTGSREGKGREGRGSWGGEWEDGKSPPLDLKLGVMAQGSWGRDGGGRGGLTGKGGWGRCGERGEGGQEREQGGAVYAYNKYDENV